MRQQRKRYSTSTEPVVVQLPVRQKEEAVDKEGSGLRATLGYILMPLLLMTKTIAEPARHCDSLLQNIFECTGLL